MNKGMKDWDGILNTPAISIHFPNQANKKEWYPEFINSLGLRPIFLFGGDFNAKHQISYSRLTISQDRGLYRTIKQKKPEPTYRPTVAHNTLDLTDVFISKWLSHIHFDI
jgi:hypothetical protein